MAERIPIIMNPAARSTKAARVVRRVEALKPGPEMHFTECVGHATEIAERLAREGRPLVVAAGGDGTVNEVLQGISRVNANRPDRATHTALGMLPAGTMNVFAYEMGFPSHKQLEQPWAVASSGKRRVIDLWMANENYFMQLAGAGLDAEVVKQTTWDMKKRFGPLSYGLSAIKVLRSNMPVVTLSAPGRADIRGCLVLMGNGRNYGGRFPMFRDAKSDDGLLDVLVVREASMNAWHAFQVLRGTLLDGYASAGDVDYLQLAEFSLSANFPAATQLDGELFEDTPVRVRKAPFSLTVAA